MTNPTNYTDEQVLDLIRYHDKEDDALTVSVLNFFREDRQRLQAEVGAERNKFDLLSKQLVAIYTLLYPPKMALEDGRVIAFRPTNLDPHELLQRLSDEIRAIPEAIDAARATPNETKEAKS